MSHERDRKEPQRQQLLLFLKGRTFLKATSFAKETKQQPKFMQILKKTKKKKKKKKGNTKKLIRKHKKTHEHRLATI
jgi:hypothetical protein